MKTCHAAALVAHLALSSTMALGAVASQSASALTTPVTRQATVDIATRLTRPPAPPPIAEEVKNPFNPPDFSQPLPGDRAAATGPRPAAPGAPQAQPAAPAGPAGDREVLETLAERIPSGGTIGIPGGRTLLVVGTGPQARRLQVGDVFTVSYNNQDYDLALVAIDRTTFTLRYRNEEIIRPIKSK